MKQLSFMVLVILGMLTSMFTNSAHARKAKVVVETVEEYANKALPDTGTVWHCWYDGAEAVLCRLGESLKEDDVEQVAQADASIDSRLPKIVSKVWNHAAALAGKLITIPLHTIPFDMAFTGELAESVMCGGSKKPCGIIFASNTTQLSELVNQRNTQLAAWKRDKPDDELILGMLAAPVR